MLSTWLRTIGGAAQVAGVLTVAWDLHRVRRDFPRPGPGLIRRAWNKVRPGKTHHRAVASGASISGGAAIGVAGEKWIPAWSVDEKFDELRDRIAQLHTKDRELGQEIRQESDERRREIREMLAKAQEELRAVSSKVEALATGAIRIRWWGVALLIVGIALATWPTEIAGWFSAS